MALASRTSRLLAVALTTACFGTAQAAVFTNANGTGLWSDALNWTNGIIGDNGEVAQINTGGLDVDGSFTISRLQNSFGTLTQRIRSNGTLTIDTNAAAATLAIANVAGNAGGDMNVDTNVVINNSQGAFSVIRNNNSANNILEFGPLGSLTLNTNAEVQQGIGGSVQFNGEIAGAANLRIVHNNVSFGATSDSPNFTGELVFLTGANVTVDTDAGNTFFGGSKLQFNGNAALTINNENVVANTPLIGFGTPVTPPTLDLTVNANQAFGNLALGAANLDLTLGAGVTSLDFLSSSAFDWTGNLNINNFTSGVIGFGFDGGLTAQQLGLITIDGAAPTDPLSLDLNGKLIAGVVAGLAGDFSGNGEVEQADLDLVLGNWGAATTPGTFIANTAGLTDGVDQDELDAVLGNWGSSTAPSFEGFAVPEPATAAIALSLAGLTRRRRTA